MLTLAFDTSTNKGSVAVLRDADVLARKSWNRESSHGELLTPALQSCLDSGNVNARDVDAFAIGHGPGSFTGVRVAVNAARAFAYCLSKPVYAFDTSEILVNAVSARIEPVLILINAHKSLVFASSFEWKSNAWQRLLPLRAYKIEELTSAVTKPHLCLGDAFDEYSSLMDAKLKANLIRDRSLSDEPAAEVVGALAVASFEGRSNHPPLVWNEVQALYIRASGAEENVREST